MDELGRLFLGDVRRRQTEGHAPPRRQAPRRGPDVSIDLTPEEFARMFGDKAAASAQPRARVQAVIAPHLNGRQSQCVRQYARHIAVQELDAQDQRQLEDQAGRVGLIELDEAGLRVSCVECSGEPSDTPPMQISEARRITEALREMNWDVRQWVLSIAHPRSPEARVVLRGIAHWTLLTTCDHDGVVGAYRALKGLREDTHPQLTLAVLNALEPHQATGVFDKLSSVCRQFLGWPIQKRIVVADDPQAMQHEVLRCDGPHVADAWEAVEQFLAGLGQEAIESQEPPAPESAASETPPSEKHLVSDVVLPSMSVPVDEPVESAPATAAPVIDAASAHVPMAVQPSPDSQVIDLPPAAATPDAMLEAILHHHTDQWAQCMLRPPMCPDARLVVGRDRRLILAAAASAGLANLAAIAQAYHWLIENRVLIGMAMPQFAIDPHAEPALRLFVDQNDLSAQALRPLFQSRDVQVQPYRRLRWGTRFGLLLEAA
jgi:hypothetical protein